MKTVAISTLGALGAAGFIAAVAAQSYNIDWYAVAGGGGTSSGGNYSVTGTIGQHDASLAMTGGKYAVVGGFWSYAAAVQMPGAPYLTVLNTGTNAVAVSWPFPSDGYILQQNADLNTTNWSAVGATPNDNGTTRTVIVSPPVGNMFFRLFHP